jgi:hypothetical protein
MIHRYTKLFLILSDSILNRAPVAQRNPSNVSSPLRSSRLFNPEEKSGVSNKSHTQIEIIVTYGYGLRLKSAHHIFMTHAAAS